jgi:hypothetical protein
VNADEWQAAAEYETERRLAMMDQLRRVRGELFALLHDIDAVLYGAADSGGRDIIHGKRPPEGLSDVRDEG